jgi:hypothetical protein
MRYIAFLWIARYSRLECQGMFKLTRAQLSTEAWLEYDRVGGGAAHQRRGLRQRRRLARFWRYLFRPSRSFIGWQPVTTQPTHQR